jgi:phage gp36-like protein
VSKKWVAVDDFRGRSKRAVKQELFAHFVLITMSRLCASASEHLLASLLNLHADEKLESEQTIQVNFKNTLTTVARHLEEILYAPSIYINQVMTEMVCSISRYYHKKREGRHYARESKQSAHQWNMRRNSA